MYTLPNKIILILRNYKTYWISNNHEVSSLIIYLYIYMLIIILIFKNQAVREKKAGNMKAAVVAKLALQTSIYFDSVKKSLIMEPLVSTLGKFMYGVLIFVTLYIYIYIYIYILYY